MASSSSSSTRLPHLLEPYLRLPPETSLILLTGVLSTTTNWLVHRYLYSLLRTPPIPTSAAPEDPAAAAAGGPDDIGVGGGSSGGAATTTTNVVLLSFLRDYAFWREGVGRLGVDLDTASKKGRLVYVDGLSALFSPLSDTAQDAAHRGPAQRPTEPGRRVLSMPTVEGLRRELEGAIAELKARAAPAGSKTVLVIDQPDLLLAAAGYDLPGLALHQVLLDIREVSVILVQKALVAVVVAAAAAVLGGHRAAAAATARYVYAIVVIYVVVVRYVNYFPLNLLERTFDHRHAGRRRALDRLADHDARERACGVRAVRSP